MLNRSINIFEREFGNSFMYLEDLKCVLNDLVQTVNLIRQRAISHARTLVPLQELMPHKLLSALENAIDRDRVAYATKYSLELCYRPSVYFLAKALHVVKDRKRKETYICE